MWIPLGEIHNQSVNNIAQPRSRVGLGWSLQNSEVFSGQFLIYYSQPFIAHLENQKVNSDDHERRTATHANCRNHRQPEHWQKHTLQ